MTAAQAPVVADLATSSGGRLPSLVGFVVIPRFDRPVVLAPSPGAVRLDRGHNVTGDDAERHLGKAARVPCGWAALGFPRVRGQAMGVARCLLHSHTVVRRQ